MEYKDQNTKLIDYCQKKSNRKDHKKFINPHLWQELQTFGFEWNRFHYQFEQHWPASQALFLTQAFRHIDFGVPDYGIFTLQNIKFDNDNDPESNRKE